MSAITRLKQVEPSSAVSKKETKSTQSGKKTVATVVEKTRPFEWTDQLREELIKRYNDPKYLLNSEMKKHNVQLISEELNIPRKVCSSQIQVLKNRGILKDLDIDATQEEIEEVPLQGSRIPFFLSDEEVEKELSQIESSFVFPFYSYNI
jgi:predicted hydrolase (HD superfamily)